jgi:hypothetical protein
VLRVLCIDDSTKHSRMDARQMSAGGCHDLTSGWLPTSGSKRITTIYAARSNLKLPAANMGASQRLTSEAATVLPQTTAASKQRNIVRARAPSGQMQRLPSV